MHVTTAELGHRVFECGIVINGRGSHAKRGGLVKKDGVGMKGIVR